MAASDRTRLRHKLLRIGGVDFIKDPHLQVVADVHSSQATPARAAHLTKVAYREGMVWTA